MNESVASDAIPLTNSIPVGAAPLESILCTEELQRRPFAPARLRDRKRCARSARQRLSRVAAHHT